MSETGRVQIESLRTHYRSGTADLGRDFFLPCLSHCTWYRRAAGFFSSSALASWAEILPSLVQNGSTKIDLLISPILPDADRATLSRLETDEARDRFRQEVADRIVLEATEFAKAPDDLQLRLKLFAWMVATSQLTLRFAFPHHVENAGIFHEKIGLFSFPWGATIAFTGSANESAGGHTDNYESIDVFRDWIASDADRVQTKEAQFIEAWSGLAPGLRVLSLSPHAMDIVRSRAPDQPPFSGLQPAGIGAIRRASRRWRHQDEAVATFLEKERGVLEMATGTGKTRIALRICSSLLHERSVETVVVSTEGTDLLDQWYDQLLELTHTAGRPLQIIRHYGPYHERDRFRLTPRGAVLLASRQALAPALKNLNSEVCRKTLLIHDEVHGLGSPANRAALAGLSDHIRYRLGLSATPDREYDADGNAFINQHIGPVLMTFGLADAIRRGILSPFSYFDLEYVADDNDRARLQQVYKQAAAREQTGNPMTKEEIWIALSRVHKTSLAKLPQFEAFIAANEGVLERSIIFVETKEYGDRVLDIVHRIRPDFHTYYAEDDQSVLKRFAAGQLECLITCHRLSQGIDIRSLKSVVLFSSARARLETIQRMGRCLRANPDEPAKRATVVDFIRVPSPLDPPDDDNADQQRRDWLRSLSTVAPEEAD